MFLTRRSQGRCASCVVSPESHEATSQRITSRCPRRNAVDHPQRDGWCDDEQVTGARGSQERHTAGAPRRGDLQYHHIAGSSHRRPQGNRVFTAELGAGEWRANRRERPAATAAPLGHGTKQRHYRPAYNGNAAESTGSLAMLPDIASRESSSCPLPTAFCRHDRYRSFHRPTGSSVAPCTRLTGQPERG